MTSLNTRIALAALLGAATGLFLHRYPAAGSGLLVGCDLVGGLFIDLLKALLIPLVFSSIVTGIGNLGTHEAQRVWQTTLLYFLSATTLATLLGLVISNVFKPGAGLSLAMFAESTTHFDTHKWSLAEFLSQFLHGLAMNPLTAMAEGKIVPTIVFAIALGAALRLSGRRGRLTRRLIAEMLDWLLLMLGWIMKLAPLGIFALLTQLLATAQFELLTGLLQFALLVLGGTLFHGLVTLPLLLYAITGVTPGFFFRGARAALLTALATSSSSATLPVTLRCTQQQLGVDKTIAEFVPPLGATLNMDGTALYEAAAALFVANLAGIELDLAQQAIVCFTAIVASIGAPGIPSAGMVTMVMVLQAVGLPAEAIAILLPMDRLLDTVRTAVNVEGDMIGSLIVQHVCKQRRA